MRYKRLFIIVAHGGEIAMYFRDLCSNIETSDMAQYTMLLRDQVELWQKW